MWNETRLRCIEAAAKNPIPHKDGVAAGVLETAKIWFDWVIEEDKPRKNQYGLNDLT